MFINKDQDLSKLPKIAFENMQMRKICSWVPENSRRVLEIGCSFGYYSNMLSGKVKEIIGLDINEEQIKQAQERYPNVTYMASDAENLPFPDGHFSNVVMVDVIEHLPSEPPVLEQVYRVLESGGELMICTPQRGWFAFLDAYNLKQRVRRLFPKASKALKETVAKKDNPYYKVGMDWHRHYSLKEIKELLGDRFEVVQVHGGGLLVAPLCYLTLSVLSRLGRWTFINSFFQRLAYLDDSINYGRAGYNLLLRARKK